MESPRPFAMPVSVELHKDSRVKVNEPNIDGFTPLSHAAY